MKSTSERAALLEALRNRSLPEASGCRIQPYYAGWECMWPPDEPEDFWGFGATPAQAYSAMCEKIENALKETK